MAGNFIIVYGDAGLGEHSAGDLFKICAQTHEKEVKTRAFPSVPSFGAGDKVNTYHISTVSELVKLLDVGDVMYLAYFGHSWNGGTGALYIGEADAPDTNLSNAGGKDDTPATKLPKDKFRRDAQIRLFGCRGGFGSDSIADQIAKHLRVKVYAYNNSGGSLFTQDKTLGHGKRRVKKADIEFTAFNKLKDTWLIPINGTPNFIVF